MAKTIFGKPIFRKDFDKENRPKEFTFFFTPTLKNYNEFVSLLDKMISDNINKDFFTGKIELFEFEELEEGIVERKQKGTLMLFEEWLAKATPEQRAKWSLEPGGFAIYWEELDDGIEVRHLLRMQPIA